MSKFQAPQAAMSHQNTDVASAGAQYGMTDPRTKALNEYQQANKKDTAAAPTWSPKQARLRAFRFGCPLTFQTMEQEMILISRSEIEDMLKLLHRSVGYCRNARPTRFPQSREDLFAEPTEFYSGASGYAGGTMAHVIMALESHIK